MPPPKVRIRPSISLEMGPELILPCWKLTGTRSLKVRKATSVSIPGASYEIVFGPGALQDLPKRGLVEVMLQN